VGNQADGGAGGMVTVAVRQRDRRTDQGSAGDAGSQGCRRSDARYGGAGDRGSGGDAMNLLMGWGGWSPWCGRATARGGINRILHDWAHMMDAVEITWAWELLCPMFLCCRKVLDQIP
jgi:hypothetical protein